MSIKTTIKLIVCLCTIGLFCSFKATLIDMQYQVRNCRIDSIKAANNWYFIYASSADTIYKIITNHDRVIPTRVTDGLISLDSLRIGNYYDLSLCRMSEYKRTQSGFLFEPMGWLGIEYLDNNTTVEFEPKRGIDKLYYCENITGRKLNNIFELRALKRGQRGIYNGVYCDSSNNRFIEIRDSTADFYIRDIELAESSSDFPYLLTATCKVEHLADERYLLVPDSMAIFNESVVFGWPNAGTPTSFSVNVGSNYTLPYRLTMFFPVSINDETYIKRVEIKTESGNSSFEFPIKSTVFSFIFSTVIDGITYSFAYPGVIYLKGGTLNSIVR